MLVLNGREFVPGRCHEWHEITIGMVTLGLSDETGYRCRECGQFVRSAAGMSAADPCRLQIIPKDWLPLKEQA